MKQDALTVRKPWGFRLKIKREIIVEIICFLFILLFVYAAASKLMDYQKFRVQLGKSPLLTNFAGWVVWIIPATEIAISILLVLPQWRLPGLYASFSLMVMFTLYIIAVTRFSSNIPCSCGGILEKLSWDQHLIFNTAFILCGLVSIIIYPINRSRI